MRSNWAHHVKDANGRVKQHFLLDSKAKTQSSDDMLDSSDSTITKFTGDFAKNRAGIFNVIVRKCWMAQKHKAGCP